MSTTQHLKRFIIVFLTLSIAFLIFNDILHRLPDQAFCTGFAVCRLFQDPRLYVAKGAPDLSPDLDPIHIDAFWNSNPDDPDQWSPEETERRRIPQYVWDYAPYVHLSSREQYWPSDLAQHLAHSTLYSNWTALDGAPSGLDAHALSQYNDRADGNFIYLHSEYNTHDPPSWLSGIDNIPRVHREQLDHDTRFGREAHAQKEVLVALDDDECRSVFGWVGESDHHCTEYCDAVDGGCRHKIRYARQPHTDLKKRALADGYTHTVVTHTQAGKSKAPAILFVVPKDDGIVDAFWFFFYSFNFGPGVFGQRFGHHGGDWEHTMIRFKNGRPTFAFLSSHDIGTALSFDALEKYDINSTHILSSWANSTAPVDFKRPVVYSAEGSHAMYGTAGEQPYVLPWGILRDKTDRGPLWDPSLNVKSYIYGSHEDVLRPSVLNPKAPTHWFHYSGRWGSRGLQYSDSRQYSLFGEQHFKVGPRGPKFKRLDRNEVCASLKRRCRVANFLPGT